MAIELISNALGLLVSAMLDYESPTEESLGE